MASNPNGVIVSDVDCTITPRDGELDGRKAAVLREFMTCASPKLCVSAESITWRRTCPARSSP